MSTEQKTAQPNPFPPYVPNVPSASVDPASVIGKPGSPVRALAFAGGLFDAAMQLGTAHALLVSDAAPPDVVVGISSGAINAVAIAEILQAGGTADTPEAQLEARVARFRAVLEAYRQSPEDVLAAFIPDFYQIDAEAPLKPTELPIYNEQERKERFRAARSKVGLIKLINDLFKLDVSIGSITRIVRSILGLRAIEEVRPWWKREAARALEYWHLWRVLASNIVAMAPLGMRIVGIALSPHADRLAEWIRTSPIGRGLVRVVAALIPNVTGDQLVAKAAEKAASLGGSSEAGQNAGSVLFRGAIRHNVAKGAQWMIGFVILLILIMTPVLALATLIALLVFAGTELARLAGIVFDGVFVHGYRVPQPIHLLTGGEWALIGIVAIVLYAAVKLRNWLALDRILRYYGIADALFDPYPLRSWFVRLFDPGYYGTSSMDGIVEAALTRKPLGQSKALASTQRTPKSLSAYARHQTSPIHVGPMAANVRTGKLNALPADTPVVDALMAATALPPVFEATKCGENWWIDGTVVANEPTSALVEHLRPLVNRDATAVHIYPVSSLPLSASELGAERTEYSGLVDSARRALTLQSFRDATLDRRLTEVVSRALPGDRAVWWPGRGERGPDGNENEQPGQERFLRAEVFPIELDAVASLNERLIGASSVAERRELIVESVAVGCRLSLEVFLHEHLTGAGEGSVPCRAVIARHVGTKTLPGAAATGGPGLPEVCRTCSIHKAAALDPLKRGPENRVAHALRVPATEKAIPVWPMAKPTDGQDSRSLPAERPRAKPVTKRPQTKTAMEWPRARGSAQGRDRPTVSLLFSGGVFRGVFLAGVIAALNEADVQPDLIAGSSIGSITAAMAARLFATQKGDGGVERRRRVQRIAATYLAVDRLVLTDRFSDFIRNFTLRGGATIFSLRDLDTAFRAFDRSGTDQFGREFRRVLAGLERLFYMSPFEVRDLAHACRMRRYNEAAKLLGAYAQEWLERGAVGLEVLGSEPLEMLIREHALDELTNSYGDPAAGFVKLLEEKGIQFIATATNLTRGRLDQLHIPSTSATQKTRLVEALLASSAFPAVFRPRWTWEVAPETSAVEQYIDGGVMDNLPLDAVASFLDDRRNANELNARPEIAGQHVPHLLFTASLEVERPELSAEGTLYTAKRWREAQRRAKELSYNNKINNYATTQRGLRTIWNADQRAPEGRFVPLDLEVIAVKPQWLCGTFAFHPMLGFKREDQARSIAHGCKSTLEKLHYLNKDEESAPWVKGWGITPPEEWTDAAQPGRGAKGNCWYREGCPCPFSRQALEGAEKPLSPNTRREVEQIYQLCREDKTHARRDPNRALNPEQSERTEERDTAKS